ncbi:MAG: ABC transporter permease [Opitutales bacterium]
MGTAPSASSAAGQPPRLAVRGGGGGIEVVFSGGWLLKAPGPKRDDVQANLEEQAATTGPVRVRAEDLTAWDTSVLPALLAVGEWAEAHDREVDYTGLPAGARRLLDLATAVPEKEGARRHNPDPGVFERIGRFVFAARAGADGWFEFIGDLVLSCFRVLRGQARMRFRDFWAVVEEVGSDALPIVTLISFLVGLIIAFLGSVVLLRFGATYYVSYLVGYGMLREMGALMTGIIMAGRTGAAFAARIGSMKVTDEISALRTLGVSPIDFLVLPRILALVLMMPLLTIYANLVGILGGVLVAVSMLDMAIPIFTNGMLEAVSIVDLALGIFKGTVFGVLVAAAGCLRGLQCGKSADAVGAAATSAVVTGITLIIASNALIDWLAALNDI